MQSAKSESFMQSAKSESEHHWTPNLMFTTNLFVPTVSIGLVLMNCGLGASILGHGNWMF
jgi:hypothetical protein